MLDAIEIHPGSFSLPLIALYAEIHYRFFPFFPSLLFKREPEVICDVPHRLDPGKDLVIMVLLNDLQRFPAQPIEVAATISQPGQGTVLFTFNNLSDHEIEHPFKKNQQVFLFRVERDRIPSGELFVNVKVTLQRGRKKAVVLNDNIPGTSKRAFSTFASYKPLPGNKLCKSGDMHVHSQFSQSHVEFGPPLKVIDSMATACGLDFVAVTDHSYDLSCAMDDYLKEDQALERWKAFQKEIADSDAFATEFIAGEEVTCLNASGRSVHLCALGGRSFIPGSMDGARRRLRFPEALSIHEVCDEVHRQGGLAVAAHPGARSGLLQRLMLHRGHWSSKDTQQYLDGFQALNSGFMKGWERGKTLWLNALQQGIRLPLIGGNDAHGDFALYRAVMAPFISIYENDTRHFAAGRTGIYGQPSSSAEILQELRKGSTFITTGPYISINYSEDPGSYAVSSEGVSGYPDRIHVHAVSTPEFGSLQKVIVFTGSTGKVGEETVIGSFKANDDPFEINRPVDITSVSAGSYLRAEVETTGCGTGDGTRGFTSPVYFDL